MLPNILRSLFLATLLSFAAPIILVVGLLVVLSLLSYVPGLTFFCQSCANQILGFLSTFGSGCPIAGILIIGLTCGIVGGLFDVFNFYRYQSLRSH